MEFKRGNTYKLSAVINNIEVSDIAKIVFKFNDLEKVYLSDGTGDVTLEDDVFIIHLSQEETLKFDTNVSYEVAVKFNDDSVKRSKVEHSTSLNTIIEKEI